MKMDQQKIGRFIAQIRKTKGLTQSQLAEKLMISEKTVSKWECGRGLPEVSIMLPLCKILGISVNELLSGEKISQDKYQEKAEQNLVQNLQQRKSDNKLKLFASVMIVAVCLTLLITCFALAHFLTQLHFKVLLLVFGFVVFALGIGFACALDLNVGYFQCPNCQHRYTPSLKSYIFGMHTIKKRHMKCPQCKKWGWHKHEISDKEIANK